MPYIVLSDRQFIDPEIRALAIKLNNCSPGTMNYTITSLIMLCMSTKTYADFNTIIGILECVKQELYRRQIAPYEDKKKSENGDVY